MDIYIVLFRDSTLKLDDPPKPFLCLALGSMHAEKQCKEKHPNGIPVFIEKNCTSYQVALQQYYLQK